MLGFIGLLGAAAYQAQRSGVFLNSFYQADRFFQHHLDLLGATSLLVSLVGMTAGLIILKFCGRSRLAVFGVILSAVALVWSGFALPS